MIRFTPTLRKVLVMYRERDDGLDPNMGHVTSKQVSDLHALGFIEWYETGEVYKSRLGVEEKARRHWITPAGRKKLGAYTPEEEERVARLSRMQIREHEDLKQGRRRFGVKAAYGISPLGDPNGRRHSKRTRRDFMRTIRGWFSPSPEPIRVRQKDIPARHLFTVTPNANIGGTSLIGTVRTPKAKLVRLLGRPLQGDGYKTKFEWILTHTATGNPVTIYDYKGDKAWHVGGHHGLGVHLMIDLRRFLASQKETGKTR